jgi:hypothetical protein
MEQKVTLLNMYPEVLCNNRFPKNLKILFHHLFMQSKKLRRSWTSKSAFSFGFTNEPFELDVYIYKYIITYLIFLYETIF